MATPTIAEQLTQAQAEAAAWRQQHAKLQATEQQWAQKHIDIAAARDTAQQLRDQYQHLYATAQARVAFLEQLYASEHSGQAAPPTPAPAT